MFCMPARKRITAKPTYFQVRMNISVQMASFGLASQSCLNEPRPSASRTPFTAPLLDSIRLQAVPTMTSEITYGTKISTRMSD
jgi:hypothetical protein